MLRALDTIFWKETIHTNLGRAIRFVLLLQGINVVLIAIDIVRFVDGTIPDHGGYYALFFAHLIAVAAMLAYVGLYYFTKPADPDRITRLHRGMIIGLGLFFLLYCAAVTAIDQFINGQITIYVIGCMTLSVAGYMPLRVTVPSYAAVHAIFLVAISRLQTDPDVLSSHYVNGTIVVIISVVVTKLMFDAHQQVFQSVSIIQDQQDKLERMAIEDSLTGLFNRRYADHRLSDEFARANRYERLFSVAMGDIDHFKRVNDTFSHHVGDEVLKHISGVFHQELRGVDIVSRYGGEEFLFIFPETEIEVARDVCEKIRKAVEAYDWHVVADKLTVTISLGVAASTGTKSPDELIRLSDQRLYKAKRSGRNRVVAAEESRV